MHDQQELLISFRLGLQLQLTSNMSTGRKYGDKSVLQQSEQHYAAAMARSVLQQ